MLTRRQRPLAAIVAVAFLLSSACRGPDAPTPRPGGVEEVVAELARRGLAVTSQTSGDPGCADRDLVDNAVRLKVTSPGAGSTHDLYLLVFRNHAAFTRERDRAAECAAAFGRTTPGVPLVSVAESPYLAYSAGLPADARTLLEDALRSAARPPP